MKTILPYRLVLAALAVFLTTAEGIGFRGVGFGARGVGVVGVRGVAVAGMAAGAYYHALPLGYRAAFYGGYNCYYAGGIYYRPVIYGGQTVYVVVQ